jgi:hypothetical protein
MTRTTRNMTALVAMLIATSFASTRATAAEPPSRAKGARAEIQLGLCAPSDRIVQALALRPTATPIKVWLFDDAALTLFGRGVRLRLRVAANGRSEFTLKVAEQDCARLERGLVPPGEGKCEYDVHGTSMAGAVSLTRHLSATNTNELVAGRVAPAQVMSPAQIRYLYEVVRIWPLSTGIHALGPMHLRAYRTPNKRYDVDISQLPDGVEYAEISRKVPVADATRAKETMEADLSRVGVGVCADQSSQAVNKLRSLLR